MKSTTIILNGEAWRYLRPAKLVRDGHRCDGYCDFEKRTIEVRKNLEGADETDTDLHELGHALMPWADGFRFIDRFGRELSIALYRLGYRKLTPQQIKLLDEAEDG